MAMSFKDLMKTLHEKRIKEHTSFLDNIKEQLGEKIPPKLFLCMFINLTVTSINPVDIPILSYQDLHDLVNSISLCSEETEFLNEMITLTKEDNSNNYIKSCEKLFEKFDKEKELSTLQLGPEFKYVIDYGVKNFTF